MARETDYPDGTGVNTTYANTPYAGSLQVNQEMTTLPPVTIAENGPSDTQGAVSYQYYDSQGNLTWEMDADGYLTCNVYNQSTDQLETTFTDINPDKLPAGQTLPAGWYSLATANPTGQNLGTDYSYDAAGRLQLTLGPAHYAVTSNSTTGASVESIRSATWTVYDDAYHATFTAQGYATFDTSDGQWDTYTLFGPVTITKMDLDGNVTDTIKASYSGNGAATIASLTSDPDQDPDGLFPQANYVAWTTAQYTDGRETSTRTYYDIPTGNYLETDYGYENDGDPGVPVGRQNSVTQPDGTVTFNVLDAQGNVVATYTGTNLGAAPSGGDDGDPTAKGNGDNMVLVSQSVYSPDGNLLRTTESADATDTYTTYYRYNWQDEQAATLAPDAVATVLTLDNFGDITETDTYGGITQYEFSQYADAGTALPASQLRAKTTASYDSLGRVYESDQYNVAQADSTTPGTATDFLPTYTWYDNDGNVIQTQTGTTGAFTKYRYNSLGGQVETYTGYYNQSNGLPPGPEAAGSWAAADTVDGTNTVVQQTETWYDGAGEAVASATYQQFAGGAATGALTAADSYATATGTWYDPLGRVLDTVNYGRQDEASPYCQDGFFNSTTWQVALDADGVPALVEGLPPNPGSTQYIVARTVYDPNGASWGTVVDQVDNAGNVDQTQYDAAGRTVETDEDDVDGTPQTYATSDIITTYQYYSGGQLESTTLDNVTNVLARNGQAVRQQVQLPETTAYVYASPYDASWPTTVTYPDGGTDQTTTVYNRLGWTTSATDQRGVTHTYTYGADGTSAAGEITLDAAYIAPGSGVDTAIQSIGTTYDDMGRVQTVTSYANSDGTGAVNQVFDSYDGWGNAAAEWQDHSGALALGTNGDPATTPTVQYTYDNADMPAGDAAPYVRLSAVAYPNGRQIGYDYGSNSPTAADYTDYAMSQLESIIDDDGTTLASYRYLGADQIVIEEYDQPGVTLDYTADGYAALDPFGRVQGQEWISSTSGLVDGYEYTYDASGNVTSTANMTEPHTRRYVTEYDGYYSTDRLWYQEQSNAPGFPTVCIYDTAGNVIYGWDAQTQEYEEGAIYANAANELFFLGDSQGAQYDAAGNMTALRNALTATPGLNDDTGTAETATWDAWGRLASVTQPNSQGGTTTAAYAYDGTGRLITTTVTTTVTGQSPVTTSSDDYYSGEQLVQSVASGGGAVYQYVWSARSAEAPILRDTIVGGTPDVTQRLYYLDDANYNITALVSYTGTVLERYQYDAYGNVTVCDAGWNALASNASQYNNTILFAGCQLDANTGLYLMGARWYDSALGRFISRDPTGYAGSPLNLYEYCGDNPLGNTDPSGTSYASVNPVSTVFGAGLGALYAVAPPGPTGIYAVFSAESANTNAMITADPSFAASYAWAASVGLPAMALAANASSDVSARSAPIGLSAPSGASLTADVWLIAQAGYSVDQTAFLGALPAPSPAMAWMYGPDGVPDFILGTGNPIIPLEPPGPGGWCPTPWDPMPPPQIFGKYFRVITRVYVDGKFAGLIEKYLQTWDPPRGWQPPIPPPLPGYHDE